MKIKWQLIVMIIMLLSFKKVILAQAPNLGTASEFALFTANGPFQNTGAINVSGNIGTNNGILTGFPPGILTGQIHVVNAISAQAAIDINTAYTFMNGITCGITIGNVLGNGQTLTPNVYCIAGNAELQGDLTLDGQGNPDALFIIKINGGFTTNMASHVILTNAADVCNVYWQVSGTFKVKGSSIFRGNAITNNNITLLNTATHIGRALTCNGAISTKHNIVNLIGSNCSSSAPLPIELISFNSSCNNQQVFLEWSTASETNNDYYSIERSTDMISWQDVGTISGMGNSNILTNYSFTDIEPYKDISYYRLKQTDFDDNFKYFDVISIKNCTEGIDELDIYPNPSNGELNLLFKGDNDKVHSVSIYNSLGKEVYNSENYQSIIDLSDQQEGFYFLHFNLTEKTIIKKLLIKK